MHPAQRRGSWKKRWCGGRPPRPGPPETLGNSLCPSELLLFTGTVRLEVVFFRCLWTKLHIKKNIFVCLLIFTMLVGFCQTTMQISHNYTYIPCLLSLPPIPTSHPSRLSRITLYLVT